MVLILLVLCCSISLLLITVSIVILIVDVGREFVLIRSQQIVRLCQMNHAVAQNTSQFPRCLAVNIPFIVRCQRLLRHS